MNLDEFDYSLLARFMDDECTNYEQERIEAWAKSHPENRKKLEQFRHIWNTTAYREEFARGLFDAEEEWDELQARLAKEGAFQGTSRSEPGDYQFRRSALHSMSRKVARFAAVFLIAGLVGLLAYQNWYQPEPKAKEPVLREVNTANAQRANLTLGDGTKVMLNAGSRIRFPNQFEADHREVFLEGEAYFEVARNPDKPFVIHAGETVTRVLGTRFTVRSYPEDQQVRVVVEEGRVSFGLAKSNNPSAKAILTANELGRYHANGSEIETAIVEDLQLYLGWREGYLKFRQKPMGKVAYALEHRYGVKVAFEDPRIKKKTLTAFLKSRSIRNVLDVIAMSLDINYKLENDKVTFTQTTQQ